MRGKLEQEPEQDEPVSTPLILGLLAIFLVTGIAVDKLSVSPGMPRH